MRTLDVLCNALPDAWCTLTLTVCANALDLLEQLPRALKHVRLVSKALEQNVLVLQQARVLEYTRDLPEECDGLLV